MQIALLRQRSSLGCLQYWIVVIEPSNLDEDLGKLMKGDAVKPWMEAEVKRAKDVEAQAEKKE